MKIIDLSMKPKRKEKEEANHFPVILVFFGLLFGYMFLAAIAGQINIF